MLNEELKIELEDLCEENQLSIDFDFNYPIQITVSRSRQVHFFKGVPEEASLRFRFIIDQIDFDFNGDFRLDNKLFGQLLSKVKKLHYIYLQEWYSQRLNRLKNCVKPMWKTVNGDTVAIVSKGYEG